MKESLQKLDPASTARSIPKMLDTKLSFELETEPTRNYGASDPLLDHSNGLLRDLGSKQSCFSRAVVSTPDLDVPYVQLSPTRRSPYIEQSVQSEATSHLSMPRNSMAYQHSGRHYSDPRPTSQNRIDVDRIRQGLDNRTTAS